MSDNKQRPLRLEPWAEVRGILHSLDEDALYATISTYTIGFPADLIKALKPFLGKRLAILRTDLLPQKEYLFRVLTEEPSHFERDTTEVDAI
jgi:hypothetical protein